MICESPDLWISAEYFASPRIENREYENGRSFSFVVDAGIVNDVQNEVEFYCDLHYEVENISLLNGCCRL